MDKEKYNSAREKLDPKIIRRLRYYTVSTVILVIIIIYELLSGGFSVYNVLIGLIIGLLAGIIIGRLYGMSWDEKSNTVVSKIDYLGLVVIVFYLLFHLWKYVTVGSWTSGNELGILVSITTGLMIGRMLNTYHNINKILKVWN